jgi:capsular exopolysaccharide synthesis family protein
MDNNLNNPMFPAPQVAPGIESQMPQRQFANPYGTEYEEFDALRGYWHRLLRRKKLILTVFILIVAAMGLYLLLKKPVYRSSAIIQIMQNDKGESILGGRNPMELLGLQDSGGKFYETQYMILDSRTMASRLIDSMNLKDHQEYKELKERYSDESPQEIEYRFIKYFLDNLEVKPKRKSYLVEVAYKSTDKKLAQDVTSAISTEYMKFAMQTRQESFAMIKKWLEGELNQLGIKVEDSEKKLIEHGKKKDFYSLEGKDNVIVKKYIELSMLLTKAEAERSMKEAQIKQIKEKGVDSVLITNNVLIQKLREEAIAQEAKVASLNKIYDANFPQLQAEMAKLKDLRQRLNNEVTRTRTSLESDYQASQRAETLIREALTAQKELVGDLQNNLVQHHILKRDMKTNEQLYQGLLARMKEASVASTMVASNVAVIASAEFPMKPYSPRPLLYLSLASIFGMVAGIGVALLLDHLDDSIKTASEMERVCQIPLLGMVPRLSLDIEGIHKENGSNLLIYGNHSSHVAESIYQLRSSIMLSAAGGAPPIIMVTSPNPAEGKTTISVNLAATLALNHSKVLIIDADMRKPSVHKAFNKPNHPGLSNLLTGNATLEEVVLPTPIADLFFIPAGFVPPNPIEMLSSKGFSDLISRLRAEYSFIVIDTPPTIGFADARIISALANAVIMVIHHNKTTRKAGYLATQLLFNVNAKILGGVLNMGDDDTLKYEGYTFSKYQDYFPTKGLSKT